MASFLTLFILYKDGSHTYCPSRRYCPCGCGDGGADARVWFSKPNPSLCMRGRLNIPTTCPRAEASPCPPLRVPVTRNPTPLLCNSPVGSSVWAPCFQSQAISKKEPWPLSRTGPLNRDPAAKWRSQEKAEKRKVLIFTRS